MGEYLATRRTSTGERTAHLQQKLDAPPSENSACVYITGSFGRGEAGTHSDLDLFIVGRTEPGEPKGVRAFKRLDEICLMAELIKTTRELKFPEFSGDGEYLVHYTIDDLVHSLGRPDDDASNTFTARLLLLLESKPLIGPEVHEESIRTVLTAYWRDFAGHENSFVPGFLVNDILRLWRTFCVNYEARTKDEPASEKAKRKLKNYKLKHSRLLTCYSALAYLLAVHAAAGTVKLDDAVRMTRQTPTERIEALRHDYNVPAAAVEALLNSYERFLETTDQPQDKLIELFTDTTQSKTLMEDAGKFGDQVADLLRSLGADPRFLRLLTV